MDIVLPVSVSPSAAELLKAKNVKLYALVNNAGLFLNTNPEMMSKFPVYSRAIIMAISFASDPLLVKYTQFKDSGKVAVIKGNIFF